MCFVSVFLLAVTRSLRRKNKTSCLVAWRFFFFFLTADLRIWGPANAAVSASYGETTLITWHVAPCWVSAYYIGKYVVIVIVFPLLSGLVVCVRLIHKSGEYVVAQVQHWLGAAYYSCFTSKSPKKRKWFSSTLRLRFSNLTDWNFARTSSVEDSAVIWLHFCRGREQINRWERTDVWIWCH